MIKFPSTLDALADLNSQLSDEGNEKILNFGDDELVTLSHMFMGQQL